MEEWEKDHIRKNFPALLSNTACTYQFLGKLCAKKVLAWDELQELRIIQNNQERTAIFYDIIQKRCNGYNFLKQALKETAQSGAFTILNTCNESNNSNPRDSGRDGGKGEIHSHKDQFPPSLPHTTTKSPPPILPCVNNTTTNPPPAILPSVNDTSIKFPPNFLSSVTDTTDEFPPATNSTPPLQVCGLISYSNEDVLGQGSFGTIVVKGKFENRDVAVKIIKTQSMESKIALKDVDTLTRLEAHPNVVRYLKTEVTEDFLFIALELCDINLHDWVVTTPKSIEIAEVKILKQMAKGLQFLHSKKIVHGDLKPTNILLANLSSGKIRLKISDFGLSKSITDGGEMKAGTDGWLAPEVVEQLQDETIPNQDLDMDPASDIFSLGCIFYFVITQGDHPFGSSERRSDNILEGNNEIFEERITTLPERRRAFIWLISHMIAYFKEDRPSTEAVLSHVAFWSPQRTLQFLQDVVPFVERTEMIEKSKAIVAGTVNWIKDSSPVLKSFLKSETTFDGSKISHLLCFFHLLQKEKISMPDNVKDEMGASWGEVLSYWERCCPILLPLVWTCFQHVKDQPYTRETLMQYYIPGNDYFFALVSQENGMFVLTRFPAEAIPKVLIENSGKFLSSFTKKKETPRHLNSTSTLKQSNRNANPGPRNSRALGLGGRVTAPETSRRPTSNIGAAFGGFAMPTLPTGHMNAMMSSINTLGSMGMPNAEEDQFGISNFKSFN